ncbi:MAG: diacylglycerol kinase family protein [Christensenellaceae bacterium]
MELVVVGGDGTPHEVLNGISDPSACRLGLIPRGTQRFRRRGEHSARRGKGGGNYSRRTPKETDFLSVGGVRCMNVGGLGMDVDVLVRCKRAASKEKSISFEPASKPVYL